MQISRSAAGLLNRIARAVHYSTTPRLMSSLSRSTRACTRLFAHCIKSSLPMPVVCAQAHKTVLNASRLVFCALNAPEFARALCGTEQKGHAWTM